MWGALSEWLEAADALVPMPLSGRRNRSRGFNQALLLARSLSKLSGLPLFRPLSRRHRPSQVGLDSRQRRRNVEGAYLCRGSVEGMGSICLIDDVMTTGSSLADAARALSEAGATSILGATLTYRSPSFV